MEEPDPIQRWSITLSRAMGSLGAEIAVLLGEQLNFHIVRQELINMAAKLAGHPEMALAAIDDLGLLNICPGPQTCRDYQHALAQLMLAEAERGGCIIIGRAGQVILRTSPTTLHLRVTAPFDLRVERVAERMGIAHPAAQERVKATDHNRQYYVRRYYHSHWDDPNQYDLVLNTACLTAHQAADMIGAALRARVR